MASVVPSDLTHDHRLLPMADSNPGPRSRDGGAAVTGVGQGDAGQVAEGVRNRDGHLAHDDMRAGTTAGGAELRRYCRQVPADALAAALPAQHVPLLFQADAGPGVALGIPAELASDLRTVRRAAIGRQQPEQGLLVRVAVVSGLGHARNLAGGLSLTRGRITSLAESG